MPIVVKTAANATKVIGFVSVRKNVERKSPISPRALPFPAGVAFSSAGFVRKRRSPMKIRMTPPIRCIQARSEIRNSEMIVAPNAATAP